MALGRFGGGDGSFASPFLIEDAWDLNNMRNHLSSHFKLANDINMSIYPFDIKKGWKPISNFTGTLDGDRHTIYNLYINRPNENHVGLFGYCAQLRYACTFRIHDIALENVDITGKEFVGGIIAEFKLDHQNGNDVNFNNMFVRVQVSGEIKGNRYIGGIAGCIDDYYRDRMYGWTAAQTIMEQCVISCKITPTGGYYAENSGIIGMIRMSSSWIYKSSTLSYSYSGNGIRINATAYLWDSDNHGREIAEQDNPACFVEKTANQYSYPATHTLTTEQLKNEDRDVLESFRNMQANGHKVFRFEKGKYPQLDFVGENYYFFRTKDDNFYTYDFNEDKWVKQFDKQPTVRQAADKGMHDINTIPAERLRELQELGKIELVNYRPQVNSVDAVDSEKTMTIDNSVQSSNPILRTRVTFNTDNDEIIGILPIT